MNAAIIVVAGLVVYLAGYLFYARYLGKRVLLLDGDVPLPSKTMRDGVDYLPTNKYVLFGHHFASIAGAAPIVGPALAVFWGWVPATLWVVFGAVLLGCVHDLFALVLSVRNRARSMGEIAGELIGERAVTAYLVIMFFVLVLVLAVFLLVISGLLIEYPEVVFPVSSLMVIALVIGVLIYRTRVGLGPASVIGIALMAAAIWWGADHPMPMPAATTIGSARTTWIVLLAGYSLVASVLPVWLLLQPRDYLESFKLYAGLALLFVGIIVTGPTIVAPAVRLDADGPAVWPFLFITIACGALSGFHSIVSSGTSSKQLACETDATFVGYGGMIGESALALCSVIACTAGFSDRAAWMAHYETWSGAAGLGVKLTAFVNGSAGFIATLGVPVNLGKTFIALIIVAFAMTTLDSACRLGRYIVGELGQRHRVPALTNRFVGAGVCAGLAFVLAMGTYGGKPAGLLLWPLFGTTNQLLACLVFATVAIYLRRRHSPRWFITVPLTGVAITTLCAMLWNILGYVREGNWLLTVVGTVILLAGLVLLVLSNQAYREARA